MAASTNMWTGSMISSPAVRSSLTTSSLCRKHPGWELRSMKPMPQSIKCEMAKSPRKVLLLVAPTDDKIARLCEAAYGAAIQRFGLPWLVKRVEQVSEADLGATAVIREFPASEADVEAVVN